MYDDHYFKSGRKSFRFIRKKTEDRSDTEIVNLGGIGEIGEMSSVFTDKKGADLKTYPVAKHLSRAIHSTTGDVQRLYFIIISYERVVLKTPRFRHSQLYYNALSA